MDYNVPTVQKLVHFIPTLESDFILSLESFFFSHISKNELRGKDGRGSYRSGKPECIPVGCVPAARRPYAEVCFPGGGCLIRGGGLPGLGGCVQSGGSAWSRGGGGGV